ncbi:MAG: 30S ribosomal protein S2 [Candidatus Marinimicrobia bacterium]|nr:30S ribosomal protein S2 [Candidatus Neomarinimicrobiota bacterium]
MAELKFEDLLATGAHFGHVTRKRHPNFNPFILTQKNGVYIINLEETIRRMEKAKDLIREVIKKNGEILFVGTKKQAQDIVQEEADKCGMFYVVERWLGGTLTNFATIRKSIKRLQQLEKEGSSIYENLTKKEIQMLNRERIKLADQHRGIKDMKRLPDAIIVVDAKFETTAVKEATRLEIPVIAIVDSNTDPSRVTHPIPANDDSIRTIQLIMSALADEVIAAGGKEPGSDESTNGTVKPEAAAADVKGTEVPENTVQITGSESEDETSAEKEIGDLEKEQEAEKELKEEV